MDDNSPTIKEHSRVGNDSPAVEFERKLAAFGIDPTAVYEIFAVRHDSLTFELYSIPFSHYNDKARWCLELARIPYTEHAYLPMFHMLPMRAVQRRFGVRGRMDVTSSPLSTPCLTVCQGGTPLLCLPDSALIARFCSAWAQVHNTHPSLFKQTTFREQPPAEACGTAVMTATSMSKAEIASSPSLSTALTNGISTSARAEGAVQQPSARVDSSCCGRRGDGCGVSGDVRWAFEEDAAFAELEQRFHDRLGVSARVVAWYPMLRDPIQFARTDLQNAGLLQALLHILLYPLVATLICLTFRINRSSYLKHRARIVSELEFVESQLEDEASPLLAGRCNVATISLAALASVALCVTHEEGFGGYLPPTSGYGREHREWAEACRRRPAGTLILQLYDNHRLGVRQQRCAAGS